MRLIDADALNGYKFGLISPYAQNLFHKIINEAPTIDYKQLLEQEPCEMTGEEYRQRMIQAFHNADCDELIAICVLPTEKEFEHLEWLLEKHYKAKPEPCDDCISRLDAINIVVCDILSSAIVYGRTEEGMSARKAIVDGLKHLPPVVPIEKEEK